MRDFVAQTLMRELFGAVAVVATCHDAYLLRVRRALQSIKRAIDGLLLTVFPIYCTARFLAAAVGHFGLGYFIQGMGISMCLSILLILMAIPADC